MARVGRCFRQLPVVIQAAVCWIPGCFVFFRDQFMSGFDRIGGDGADARLVVVLHEHWINVFRGRASWTSPDFFFPAKGTLGYSDTLLLNQIFYAPLRAVGLDAFLAFESTIILLSLVGFAGFFVLCRTELALGVGASFALATAFAFANNLNIVSVHPQLYSVYWLPLLLLLAIRALHAPRRSRQLVWGAATGLVLGMILFSTYYIAWFVVLAAVVFALVLAPFEVIRLGWRRSMEFVGARLTAMVGFFGGVTVGVVPFLVVYLPVLRSNGGRTYGQVMSYAPSVRDALNLGESNYLWGTLVRGLVPLDHLRNTETSLAVTPVLIIVAVAAIVVACGMWRSRELAVLTRICAAAGVTALVLAVLPIKFGVGSLWRVPWTVMPGAEGIRAIGRVDILVAPISCVTAAIGYAIIRRVAQPSLGRMPALAIALALLLALVVAEQFNVGEFSGIDRSVENERLTEAPHPPSTCRSFFIIDREMLSFVANIDAMLLAVHLGIPTVNGYSGQYPPGYILLDMADPAYFSNVRAWVKTSGAEEGLCSYDTVTRRWSPTPADSH